PSVGPPPLICGPGRAPGRCQVAPAPGAAGARVRLRYHRPVRYAVHLHVRGALADPRRLVDLAVAAEDAGWDGVFVSDHLATTDGAGPQPVANPWIALAAMATATRRVRLGPMVVALPRRRPWQVA